MGNLEPKKLALIRIWQILKEHSDCDHPLTQDEIGNKLNKEYGIAIERKAISRNISLLKEAGADIESRRGGTYLNSRDFEDSELRMLIDGVLSSKYITSKHSKELIDRICALSNKYFRSSVKHIHSVDKWGKTENQALFYNIDLISAAIENNKQIRYDYNKYGINKKLQKSSEQNVSPYLMILHNQRYYLMAYNEYWKNMAFHRLDHITNMEITDKKATPIKEVPGYENGIDYKKLSSARPYMYTDEPERIEFIADDAIVNHIVDWFGTDIRIVPDRENKVKVSVEVSPNAMEHWAMQYINHVEITYPESLRKRIKDILKNAVDKYR